MRCALRPTPSSPVCAQRHESDTRLAILPPALHELLAYGEARFGRIVVDEKRARVERTIAHILRDYPGIGRFEANLGIYSYPVARTPFVLLYDFDATELRLHLIVHGRADRSRIVIDEIEW